MNEVYVICSESGDEYKLQFTTERSGMIADEILDELQNSGIEVVEVGLGRNKGLNVTSHLVLAQVWLILLISSSFAGLACREECLERSEKTGVSGS